VGAGVEQEDGVVGGLLEIFGEARKVERDVLRVVVPVRQLVRDSCVLGARASVRAYTQGYRKYDTATSTGRMGSDARTRQYKG
jgi:hypothetical protein